MGLSGLNEIATRMGYGSVPEAIAGFREMLKKYELSNPVSHNYEDDVNILTESVNPVRLKNNPIQFENAVILKMYRNIVRNTN